MFLLLPAPLLAEPLERGLARFLALLLGDTPRVAARAPWDWIAHGVLFTVLAWAWCAPAARAGKVRGVFVAAAGAVAYGGAIEVVQRLVGYRSGEWMDLVADAVGVGVGALLATGIWPRLPR
ncbi:MAG: VanZ family protein [Acidobacteria bacterium]|nr:VanZ family protein [Acidobacteriota bacterium]